MRGALETTTPVQAKLDSSQLEPTVIGSRMAVGISSFGSWMLGVGTMIGSMAWLIYQPMLARSGALPTVCAWTCAAFITLPLAFVLAELSSMFPSAGGPYIYKYVALKRLFPHFGELLGFTTGWLYWIAMVAGVACMTNGFAALVASSVWSAPGSAPWWFGSVAIGLLLLVSTLINLRHVREVSRLNNLFTILKVVMAFAFVGLVLFSKNASLTNIVASSIYRNDSSFIDNVMKVLVLSITAFAGIELVACSSSETVNPTRNIPKAILLTLLTVALIYISICLSICSIAPYDLSGNTAFQATCPSVASFIGGPIWGIVFTAGVVVSIITCTFNALLALARISYSMAETKLFPAKFARLDEKDSVPKDALWFQFWCVSVVSIAANVVATIVPHFDPYTFLGEVFGFLYSFLAVLYGVCLISLRYTDPERSRPFRIGRRGNALAWVMCITTALVYGFIAFGCSQPIHQFTAVVLVLCGLPVYWLYRRPSSNPSTDPKRLNERRRGEEQG